MSFQAYLDTIRAKTGKTPEQIKAAATKAGSQSTPGLRRTMALAGAPSCPTTLSGSTITS